VRAAARTADDSASTDNGTADADSSAAADADYDQMVDSVTAEAGIKITGGVMNIQFRAWAMDRQNNERTVDGGSKTVAVTGCIQ
jgi:hypothetical protein